MKVRMNQKAPAAVCPISEAEIEEANATLRRYAAAKAPLEARILEDEQWWKLRHWDYIRARQGDQSDRAAHPAPTSAWLFSTLCNKHADFMDNYPTVTCLPRERSDEPDARALSSILPVIAEQNHFNDTYSQNVWYKLKHGTACYGVFWNPSRENGLGDIDIRRVDLLNLFWEPGITDIQDSKNLFVVNLMDTDELLSRYPQLHGRAPDSSLEIGEYLTEESGRGSREGKSLVVDWYYKVRENGQVRLHYAKFTGSSLLYASENDPTCAEGWYAHGQYPVVFDTLYPEDGTPYGFGIIAVTKDPQMYIDMLDRNIMETALWATRRRYFAKKNVGINEADFLDPNKPIVEVEGDITEERLREITSTPLDSVYVSLKQMKIDELKETSFNRDVTQGASSNVTAASAIVALQEAGNKNSRDSIAGTYRAYEKIMTLCVELIRQFYDEARCFRIAGEGADYAFVEYSNRYIREKSEKPLTDGTETVRRPVFDFQVCAEKKNPYSRISQNETAKALYSMGAFLPENAEQASIMLDMMNFDGVEKVRDRVSQGKTLAARCEELARQVATLQAALGGAEKNKVSLSNTVESEEPDGKSAVVGSRKDPARAVADLMENPPENRFGLRG